MDKLQEFKTPALITERTIRTQELRVVAHGMTASVLKTPMSSASLHNPWLEDQLEFTEVPVTQKVLFQEAVIEQDHCFF